MNLEKANYCQSCGMPLFYENVEKGIEKDGSFSEDYCNECYIEGKFTLDNITIDQMINHTAHRMADAIKISYSEAQNALSLILPQLNRWTSSTLKYTNEVNYNV